jgi:hypothetical protein
MTQELEVESVLEVFRWSCRVHEGFWWKAPLVVAGCGGYVCIERKGEKSEAQLALYSAGLYYVSGFVLESPSE